MVRTLLLILTVAIWFLSACCSAPAYAQAERTRNCSHEAKENINQAIQYMELNLDTLRNDYEFDARLPRKDERVRRRMARKIDDIKVHCAETRFRCRDVVGKSAGVITDRIHICYEKMRERGSGFCDLVGVVSHEYGHMIGMPRALFGRHNDGAIDATRMFGWFVEDLCEQDNLDRPLADFTAPLTPHPHTPTSGIIVFPDPDFGGRGRQFTEEEFHGTNAEFLDLRHIGRNDAVSSVQVLSGVWELCEHQDFRGWCHVFNHDEARLKDRHFNDTISSLRPITLPRQGLTVFQDPNFEGGSQHFTVAMADLSEVGLTTVDSLFGANVGLDFVSLLTSHTIQSLQTNGGRLEVCEDTHFRRCVLVDGPVHDVRRLGVHEAISSLRPVP